MSKKRSILREYLEAALIAVIFLKFANTFVLETFYIPSSSMEETLLIGDRLFVNRFIYGQTPSKLEQALLPGRPLERGDIVVFRSVEDPKTTMVKRCIGLPGDEIEIRAKLLYINGERVDDADYAIHSDPRVFDPSTTRLRQPFRDRDFFGPITVPDEHYFCMGDNRDQSHDSRFWGPLPASHVKGRTFVIYWSYGGGTPDGSPQSFVDRVKQVGSTLIGFFPETRWNRTFRLIR